MTVVGDHHQVSRHVERNAMRIGELGRVASQQANRCIVVRCALLIDHHGPGTLDREEQLLTHFVGGDAPRPVRRGEYPVRRRVAARASRENVGSQFWVSLFVTYTSSVFGSMYEPHIISVRVWSPPITRRGSVNGAPAGVLSRREYSTIRKRFSSVMRSEEHTSELQSQ